MHAQHGGSDFPVQVTRVPGGAGDEEAFETEASPPAVAGPLISFVTPRPRKHNAILLDLLTGAETLADSLALLAAASVRAVVGPSTARIECGVVVQQAKRPPTIAGTSPEANRVLDWEQVAHEGPVLEVLNGEQCIAVLQRGGDFRWPRYCRQLQLAGFGSALSLRLPVEQDLQSSCSAGVPGRPASAALAYFTQDPKAFPLDAISRARSFADLATRSLQTALDLFTARSEASDLRSALDSRTSINVACGVIMAQNRCSYLEAFTILAKASSHRNIKVRRIAEDILERLPEGPPQAHFGR